MASVIIEVFADVVCPWCYIGRVRLHKALEQFPELDVQLVHRAFQLDAATDEHDHRRTVDVLSEKYGKPVSEMADMMTHVTLIAADEGLNYRLDETVNGNTRNSHRLLLWAQDLDEARTQQLIDHMYTTYFEQAQPVFDIDDLVALAAHVGFDDEAARQMLLGNDYSDRVAEDIAIARDFGIQGVPFVVIDRKLGVSGAQQTDTFVAALNQALEN